MRRTGAIVVIPTLNEVDNLRPLVAGLLSLDPSPDVLVIDDRSTDGTYEVARALAANDERVHLIERPRRLGLGTAYRDAFLWAMSRGYESIVQMDADRSHDPADVPRLLQGIVDANICCGSRYLPGGGCEGWSRRRHLLSRASALYVRPILGLTVSDPLGGFKAYRADRLAELEIHTLAATGFLFQCEVLYRASRAGLRISEIPILFRERASGTSKMNARIILEALFKPWAIRLGLVGRFRVEPRPKQHHLLPGSSGR